MSGINNINAWERSFKPHRDHIARLNGQHLKTFCDTLQGMIDYDCASLTDEELSDRLAEELELGTLSVRGGMAVMEASIRLKQSVTEVTKRVIKNGESCE